MKASIIFWHRTDFYVINFSRRWIVIWINTEKRIRMDRPEWLTFERLAELFNVFISWSDDNYKLLRITECKVNKEVMNNVYNAERELINELQDSHAPNLFKVDLNRS